VPPEKKLNIVSDERTEPANPTLTSPYTIIANSWEGGNDHITRLD